MPYKAYKEGDEWCVHKHDTDNKPVGESLGCHPTEAAANEQIAALYANENKAVVKAITEGEEWVLEIRGVPFGSRSDRDAQGEWFDAQTNFHEDKYGFPPLVHYHSFDPHTKQATSEPAFVGKTFARETRQDGIWFRGVLDKANVTARKLWEAAKEGMLRASSGSILQLARKAPDGHIKHWPVAELTLVDLRDGVRPANGHAVAVPAALKAVYEQAGIAWPELEICDDCGAETEDLEAETQEAEVSETSGAVETTIKAMEDNSMAEETTTLSPEQVTELVNQSVAQALKADREAQEAKREEEKARQEEIEAAIKAAKEEWDKEAAKDRRLPFKADDAPVVGKFGELRKYQHLDASDMACMIDLLNGAGAPVSDNAYKALIIKTQEDQGEIGAYVGEAIKAQGIDTATKADELNRSTLVSYGNEWAGAGNSTQIWGSVRRDSVVGRNVPSIEVPQGSESILIPLESTDPIFYTVAQAADDAASGGLSRPSPTVTSSLLGTANNTITLNKMGARVRYTGEMVEDSLVQFVPQLNNQIRVVAQEYFDHVILDGDTHTTASVNINDIAGTPGGTEAFLMFNGFRYTALKTSGRNRSGGSVDEDDFVDTMALLGTAGEAADPDRCAFIVDVHTHRKMLKEITALKTADVYPGAPTITAGKITQIWGYPVLVANAMGYVYKYGGHTMTGYEKKFNTSGYIDQDTSSGANNTTGMILLARWDRWYVGWKRRMTMEVTRHPEWDGSEIVTLMRFGLLARDTTNAVACTYNVSL